MFEGLTCVYRSNIDLYFYVIGSSSENEVIETAFITLLIPIAIERTLLKTVCVFVFLAAYISQCSECILRLC